MPGFLPRGRSGDGALDVGSPTGVEVVVGKVHRKKYFNNGEVIHMTMEGFEAFNGEGRVARKGLSH